MIRSRHRTFTLIELVVVILIMAMLIAVLLPSLNCARKAALSAKLRSPEEPVLIQSVTAPHASPEPIAPGLPLAQVSSFDGKVDLTPRLSVGTAEPESIYE